MDTPSFEWDKAKDWENRAKHGVSFESARLAFSDSMRVISEDSEHCETERRYFCFGLVEGRILTVRFTYREDRIRIFGAGYWRKGKAAYEEKNRVHRWTDWEISDH